MFHILIISRLSAILNVTRELIITYHALYVTENISTGAYKKRKNVVLLDVYVYLRVLFSMRKRT